MVPVTLLNGRANSTLSWGDRGFAYGDGLFETIRVERGVPCLLDLHLDRLLLGCRTLRIGIDPGELRQEIGRCLSCGDSGVLKIVVTRAAAGRGYAPSVGMGQRALLFYPGALPPRWNKALNLRLCRQPLSEQPALAGIKHLNRLEQVLARAEWRADSFDEGIMLDQRGRLIEATAANLFLVVGSQLMTPRLTRCGVAGVMRRLVMERLAPALELTVREVDLPLPELYQADELFLTSALLGIGSAASVDCLPLPGQSVTIALQSQLKSIITDETAC